MKNNVHSKKYVGVDGCHYGWCTVIFNEHGQWQVALYNSMADLWEENQDAALILIDMPIGVLDNGTDRPCDYEVRKLIGKRRSSLFPMPCRGALYAATYKEASLINFRKTGKRLSREMWNIMPKMRQLNDFLVENTKARTHIKETHPELCFTGLNGGKPMEYAKKKEKELAFEERLGTVQRFYPMAFELIEKTSKDYRRKDVARDDIMDALALAVTALMGENRLTVISSEPKRDANGLPMQMLYYLKKGESHDTRGIP